MVVCCVLSSEARNRNLESVEFGNRGERGVIMREMKERRDGCGGVKCRRITDNEGVCSVRIRELRREMSGRRLLPVRDLVAVRKMGVAVAM